MLVTLGPVARASLAVVSGVALVALVSSPVAAGSGLDNARPLVGGPSHPTATADGAGPELVGGAVDPRDGLRRLAAHGRLVVAGRHDPRVDQRNGPPLLRQRRADPLHRTGAAAGRHSHLGHVPLHLRRPRCHPSGNLRRRRVGPGHRRRPARGDGRYVPRHRSGRSSRHERGAGTRPGVVPARSGGRRLLGHPRVVVDLHSRGDRHLGQCPAHRRERHSRGVRRSGGAGGRHSLLGHLPCHLQRPVHHAWRDVRRNRLCPRRLGWRPADGCRNDESAREGRPNDADHCARGSTDHDEPRPDHVEGPPG